MQTKKKTVLLSAYACGPDVGSEPGVGWGWAKSLAPHHDLIVLTSIKYRSEIEKTELFKTATFLFIETNKVIEYLFPKLSRWKYYVWQYYALKKIKKLNLEERIDLIHHVTFIQFISPAFGFFINKPFVFGPLGGGELIAPQFYGQLNLLTRLKELGRKIIITIATKYVKKIRKHDVIYIFANKSTRKVFFDKVTEEVNSVLLPAIYIDEKELLTKESIEFENIQTRGIDNTLRLILPTRLLDWKGIIFGIDAIEMAIKQNTRIELKIIGDGPLKRKLIKYIKIKNRGEFIKINGRIERNKLLQLYRESDALFYPAFRDSGAMVIAEAYLSGKPAIILDIESQDYLDDKFSYKAKIGKSYKDSLINMADCLTRAYSERELLITMGSEGKKDLITKLAWSLKLSEVSKIYSALTEEKNV